MFDISDSVSIMDLENQNLRPKQSARSDLVAT